MARGGRRTPNEPASYSGVGKQSRRTDTQRVQAPNVGDAEDLSYGDRQKLEDAQRTRPLGRAPSPRVEPVSPAGSAGGGATPLGLPDYTATMPSSRPDEPLTEGMSFGPGAGPEVLTPEPEDDMDVVLQALVQITGDQGIANLLDEHREFKAWRTQRQTAPAIPQAPVAEDTFDLPAGEPTEDVDAFALPDEDLATEEEPVEAGGDPALSVETPASAPPMEGGDEASATLPTSEGV